MCLFGVELLSTAFRLEMIVKVMLISFFFMVMPSLNFGTYRNVLLLLGALAVIATSSFTLDSKTTARTAIAIALLPAILRIRIGPAMFGAMLFGLWFLQDAIRSRGLEFTIAVFVFQMLLFKLWPKPWLFYLFPLVYVTGMATIGFLFIFADGIIEATASNIARSSLIFTTIQGLLQNPFGYLNEQDYFSDISPLALNLYSESYNDPHNFFMTTAVWGGFPLLLFSIWAYYIGLRDMISSTIPQAANAFAASALVVFLSTSTLSFGNVLFFGFLICFISQYRAPEKLKSSHLI